MPSWKPSPRFTIRGVLLLTLVVAVVLAVWRCRPSPWLAVEVTPRGTVMVQDKEVLVAELPAVLGRESERRKLWWMRDAWRSEPILTRPIRTSWNSSIWPAPPVSRR